LGGVFVSAVHVPLMHGWPMVHHDRQVPVVAPAEARMQMEPR
jgi:hypothetical protein